MGSEIDEASFVLGQLKGEMRQMARTQDAMLEKLDKIDKSITHIKVKSAGQAASVAIIISLVIAFFSKVLKWN